MPIEGYLQALVTAIGACPYVESSNLSLDIRGPDAGFIRGEVNFSDGSRLSFRELLEFESELVRLTYSFHYRRSDDSLIFRYDDTPHHQRLPNFPHHKHEGNERNVINVVPSDLPTLSVVLEEIERLLSSEQ